MTRPVASDWHGVAMARLTAVMGDRAGREIADAVLAELGLTSIGSSSALRRFAAALALRGGFAAAVGAMLELHATMYEETPNTPPVAAPRSVR